MKLPAGVVYRLFSAEHAHVFANIVRGMISAFRALHSLVLHKCKVSVFDIRVVLVYKILQRFQNCVYFHLHLENGKRDPNTGHCLRINGANPI